MYVGLLDELLFVLKNTPALYILQPFLNRIFQNRIHSMCLESNYGNVTYGII